ncbi:MAG: phosphate starvation-inducible protein PhoH [Opitutae bacterium]|nr:phosphate starvation-inducible protein PhoH [Opitutae bacterium]
MASKKLQFANGRLLNQLHCGKVENLTKTEQAFGVQLVAREDWLLIEGSADDVKRCEEFFELLLLAREGDLVFRNGDFERILEKVSAGHAAEFRALFAEPLTIRIKKRTVVPRSLNQQSYLKLILKHDIVCGIGPAGTGKTFLAMTAALKSLVEGEVEKVILTRPAVEAGEALGFLPGDLEEKLFPYLRPLHDAMEDLLGTGEVRKLIEKGAIEIAPLAYMRGRTLSRAFAVLDEAQNATTGQMMMFLTRLGEGSKMVVTGDVTQIDLPRPGESGLKQAEKALSKVSGVKFFHFDSGDVVRHSLVRKIIEAYRVYSQKNADKSLSKGNHR